MLTTWTSTHKWLSCQGKDAEALTGEIWRMRKYVQWGSPCLPTAREIQERSWKVHVRVNMAKLQGTWQRGIRALRSGCSNNFVSQRDSAYWLSPCSCFIGSGSLGSHEEVQDSFLNTLTTTAASTWWLAYSVRRTCASHGGHRVRHHQKCILIMPNTVTQEKKTASSLQLIIGVSVWVRVRNYLMCLHSGAERCFEY